MGGKDCKICRMNLLTAPQALVSTRKMGLRALVTRKCDDCLTRTITDSRTIMNRVIPLTMVRLCFSIMVQPIQRSFSANSTPITPRETSSSVPCIPTGS